MEETTAKYSKIPKEIRKQGLSSLNKITKDSSGIDVSLNLKSINMIKLFIKPIQESIENVAVSDEILTESDVLDDNSAVEGLEIVSNLVVIFVENKIRKRSSEEEQQRDGDDIYSVGVELANAYAFSKLSLTQGSTRSSGRVLSSDTCMEEQLCISTENLKYKGGRVSEETASNLGVNEGHNSVLLPKSNVLKGREGNYIYTMLKWDTNLREGLSEPTSVLSSPIHFSLTSERNNNLRITNLQDSIILQINYHVSDCDQVLIQCRAFDQYQRRYRTEGMSLVHNRCFQGLGTATCLTNHLSEFVVTNTSLILDQNKTEADANITVTGLETSTNDNEDYKAIESASKYIYTIYIYIYIYI